MRPFAWTQPVLVAQNRGHGRDQLGRAEPISAPQRRAQGKSVGVNRSRLGLREAFDRRQIAAGDAFAYVFKPWATHCNAVHLAD